MTPLEYRHFLINMLNQLEVTDEMFQEVCYFMKLGLDTKARKVSKKYLEEVLPSRDDKLKELVAEFIQVFDYDFNVNRIYLNSINYKIKKIGDIISGQTKVDIVGEFTEKKKQSTTNI